MENGVNDTLMDTGGVLSVVNYGSFCELGVGLVKSGWPATRSSGSRSEGSVWFENKLV